MQVRIAKDEPDFLPPNGRIQLDGVGTNWGKTTFAHLTDLVDDGLADELLCARNPVGNTHEDIDAIFARGGSAPKKAGWRSVRRKVRRRGGAGVAQGWRRGGAGVAHGVAQGLRRGCAGVAQGLRRCGAGVAQV